MNLTTTRLHLLHTKDDLGKKAATGISLHCHTKHSKEMLDFVPHYAKQIPIIAGFWAREQEKYTSRYGNPIDFTKAYWEPPLDADAVLAMEQKQINEIGLAPMVSITDHDSIGVSLELTENRNDVAPISLEWTVPYEQGFFHLGIHNLPPNCASEITENLTAYSFPKFGSRPDPEKRLFRALLDMLVQDESILIVFNHPLWDIELIGQADHNLLLKRFIREFGGWIHAFEINGFRSWSENMAVVEMGESLGIPLVTGGDRHGCQPNTVLNLSDSTDFSGFVEEIRADRYSQVVFMPEYRQPILSRQLRAFAEILETSDKFEPGREKWIDRVFIDIGNEKGLASLSEHGWVKQGPPWLRAAIWTLGLFGSNWVRPIFKFAQKPEDRVPRNFEITEIITPLKNEGTDLNRNKTEFAR